MKKKLFVAIILSIFVYFGQRIVRVLAEPDLPTQEGLFILPLECKDVKLVCSSTIPKRWSLTKSKFFQTVVDYMHRIEKTGLLTADRLIEAVPDIDWLHGHSGELLSVDNAEKLGMFIVNELKDAEENEDVYFDSYNQKKYVIGDILTFMCPQLKKRLLEMGKNKDPEIKDINELMINVDDDDYSKWINIEDHLSLERLNGVLM